MEQPGVVIPRAVFRGSGGTQVIILGIDTAGRSGSVALVDETQVLASFYLRQVPTFSSPLMHLVDVVCSQAGYRVNDLEGFAVSLGPGGFTSLRVALATAQGLAMATGKPLVGCSTFEALVAFTAGWNGSVCAVLEARRGEVYAAFYDRQGATVREIRPGMVTTPDALCALVTERTLFVGSGVQTYGALWAATLGAQVVCLESVLEGELAASVARLGQTRLRGSSPTARLALKLLYIRAADARLPRHPATVAEPSLPLGASVPGR
jgi:tRNA threonylcarbamoyladenosine biosynthesis protein TsaB